MAREIASARNVQVTESDAYQPTVHLEDRFGLALWLLRHERGLVESQVDSNFLLKTMMRSEVV